MAINVCHSHYNFVCSWVKSCDWVKRLFGLKREEVMEVGEQCTKNFFCLTPYTLLSILNVIYYNQNPLWFITILILPQIHVISLLNPFHKLTSCFLNPLAPSDLYMSRTAQLTSRRCILNTYSTNIHTEYFKHAS
jgi:hypothetical protein